MYQSTFRINPLRLPGMQAALLSIFAATGAMGLQAQTAWVPVGPAGGDARAFAAVPGEPNHIYMGTTDSWLYESTDGGASWLRLSKIDPSDDLILDNIVVDTANPRLVYVAAWRVDHPDGGLWVSHDGGKTWTVNEGMRGQSIRALTQASSDPKMLFTGTLQGVFRSTNAGASWTQISPPGSQEIHEVESVAVDPVDPKIIYAGTWHLPWKTVDGGKNWHNIKQGLIDDSDVFSIILSAARSSTVYLSACSGIYKSEDSGESFKKIQGIPSTARRTRVLMQDPVHHDVVYAGTTEGLYKTVDAGKTFQRMTGPDVIVNDVYVDPANTNHVLLATDRSGVLFSKDAGSSFIATNEGFSARKVEALLADFSNPSRLIAGVVNDKTYGGVFQSNNGGAAWDHIGEGLEGRDVFALAEAPDGTIVAGTNHGIFALAAGAASGSEPSWAPRNTIQNMLTKKTTEVRKGKKVEVEKQVKDVARQLDGRVYALDLLGDVWFASTSNGLLTSKDHGASWQGGLVLGSGEYVTAAAHGSTLAAARRDGLVVSADAGLTWTASGLPAGITRIHRAAFSPDGTLWLGTREGVYLSHDQGKTWLWMERLPFRDVTDLYYDAHLGKVLVSSLNSDFIYFIDPQALGWSWTRSNWKIHLIRAAGGRLIAASPFDGVLVQQSASSAMVGQK